MILKRSLLQQPRTNDAEGILRRLFRSAVFMTVLAVCWGGQEALADSDYNLDFRYEGEQWEGIDGTFWRFTENALSHGRALQRVIYAGSSSRERPFEVQFTQPFAVTPGKRWLVEGYVSLNGVWDESIKAALRLRFHNASGAELETYTTSPRTPYQSPFLRHYSRIAGLAIVPKGAVEARLSLLVFVEEDIEATRFVAFDDLRVGDFDAILKETTTSYYSDAEQPAPIALEPEDAGAVTQGLLNRGKFYTFSRPPYGLVADRYPNKWTDGTLLTDGAYPAGGVVFDKDFYVGWDGAEPVSVVFDLGRVQTLQEVRIHSVFHLPQSVEVKTRLSRTEAWRVWKQQDVSDRGYRDTCTVIELGGAPVQALEVEVTLHPDRSVITPSFASDVDIIPDNTIMLVSEIELIGDIKNTWRQVPADGVYHGAFPTGGGFTAEERADRPEDAMRVDLFEQTVGKPLSMILWYQKQTPERGFSEIQELRRRHLSENFYGHRMMTYGWLGSDEGFIQEVVEGKHDDFFEQYFRDSVDPSMLMGIDDPVWFRPNNEFNGRWLHYACDPALFVRYWWRMYNIAEKVGAAQKHIFIWAPNHRSYPDQSWNKMEHYWPGDQYVDWVGLSCYPFSMQYAENEDDLYAIARFREVNEKFGHYKPLKVTEGGFGPEHVCKVRWVKEWFELPDVYPNLRALIWENHDHSPTFRRTIQSCPEALSDYRRKVQSDRWLATHWTGRRAASADETVAHQPERQKPSDRASEAGWDGEITGREFLQQ